jgi:DNA polymerase III gamma/tau subunit
MITKRTQGDFARSYRPWRISEVYGQEEIKKVIGTGLDEASLPNSMLFYGESGVGKTSMARIVAAGLNCSVMFQTDQEKKGVSLRRP